MPLPILTVVRAAIAVSALWSFALLPHGDQVAVTERPRQAPLGATQHPPIPLEDADAWMVPDRAPDERERTLASMAEAHADEEYARVLSLAPRLAGDRDLGGYARLYQARAYFAQSNVADARRILDPLARDAASPYLAEQARLLAAQAAIRTLDHATAIEHLEALMKGKPLAPERALLWLGRAHALANDTAAASVALTRVHYEFPLSPEAAEAGTELQAFGAAGAPAALRLRRAEALFGARRFTDAKREFEAIRASADGDQRDLADLRIAEIDAQTGRHAQARAALATHMRRGPRQAEARYFDAIALRDAGQRDAFAAAVRELASEHRDSKWAADALDALASHYVRTNEDERAEALFTEIFDRYPSSPLAERAAWMAGWRAYRERRYAETIRIFERAAADYPRATKRADWLYWAGRARAEAGQASEASARQKLVLADYAHSYYGRQAARRLGATPPKFQVSKAADRRSDRTTEVTAREAVPTGLIIHRLLRAGLYDDALGELRAAERAWGTTPVLQATIAWATREKGDLLLASVQMKRAYPQYLSQLGEDLPDDVLRVTYPIAYWPLIKKYSEANGLDPYVIAALIAQESGYNPKARSAADAYGLMQVVPATGRSYAKKLGIRGFTTQSLFNPEINIRIGTKYFADQLARFGSVHATLAGYNAGPTRARRWSAEKPGLERDEWIDDIPFPETQFYVKRILGTAEDYRLLYGQGSLAAVRESSR